MILLANKKQNISGTLSEGLLITFFTGTWGLYGFKVLFVKEFYNLGTVHSVKEAEIGKITRQ